MIKPQNLTFATLSLGSRQQSSTQQAICPDPAYFWSSSSLSLFSANPFSWAPPFTSDPSDTGRAKEPAKRPEDLRGVIEEPAQVKDITHTLRGFCWQERGLDPDVTDVCLLL